MAAKRIVVRNGSDKHTNGGQDKESAKGTQNESNVLGTLWLDKGTTILSNVMKWKRE